MSLDQETWVLEFFSENISVKTIAASYNWTIGMSLNFETKLDNLLQQTLSLINSGEYLQHRVKFNQNYFDPKDLKTEWLVASQ